MTPRLRETFTFYDMFCGIGAFHLAATRHRGRCVGACDIDRFARETYAANFGFEPDGDVRDMVALPEGTDWLFAGFPCPTFSIAGKSKLRSLGREHGFQDTERGTLIFEVARVVEASDPRPSVIILENVKHLLTHDEERTFLTIVELFAGLGYDAVHAVLDSINFGTPQHRPRVFIALFLGGAPFGFELPETNGASRPKLRELLEPDVPEKYTLGPNTWETLRRHKRYHRKQGNGFGYRLIDPSEDDAACPTLSARYYKDGGEALIKEAGRSRPRRLTPREAARIMTFPETFRIPVSDTQAYRQFGNSIVVSVADAVVGSVVEALRALAEVGTA